MTESVPEKERFPYGTDDPSRWRDRAGPAAGPKLLRNLKENGNYLTPGGGINLMSLIAVVLRGAILNLLFWIPPIAVLLGVLHVTGGYKMVLWARDRPAAAVRARGAGLLARHRARGFGATARLQGAPLDRTLGGPAHRGRADRGTDRLHRSGPRMSW